MVLSVSHSVQSVVLYQLWYIVYKVLYNVVYYIPNDLLHFVHSVLPHAVCLTIYSMSNNLKLFLGHHFSFGVSFLVIFKWKLQIFSTLNDSFYLKNI